MTSAPPPLKLRKLLKLARKATDNIDYDNPPPPFPYIDYGIVLQILHPIEPPQACPYCHSSVSIERLERLQTVWPFYYVCQNEDCRARVGCHRGTPIPLGQLATYATRKARRDNKAIFYRYIEKSGLSQNAAYVQLAQALGIPRRQCHFAMFDENTAYAAGEICLMWILDMEIRPFEELAQEMDEDWPSKRYA